MNGSSSEARLDGSRPTAGILDVSGVTVRFGGLTALDDVSLNAAPRQITGIIGPNGAGKTTLLNSVCGFVRPTSGTISLDGHDITGIRPHRLADLGIARTLQGVGLFRGLSVAENVMVGATHVARAGFWSALFGLPWSDRDERRLREQAMAALSRVGVAEMADSMPETLAYGVRKRVALARALVGHPRLLLLDEPASGLSEKELPELGQLIREFAAEASVVVIEHRMDLMMSICDAIFVLDFGKLIATGTPEQVWEDTAVTAAYLGTEVPGGAESEAGEGAGRQAGAGAAGARAGRDAGDSAAQQGAGQGAGDSAAREGAGQGAADSPARESAGQGAGESESGEVGHD
jgi:branched-chain amino acid transport system ATP-binding protein